MKKKILLTALSFLSAVSFTIFSSDSAQGNPDSCYKLVEEGNLLLKKNRTKALALYGRAAEKCPESYAARFNFGLGAWLAGETMTAVREFREALRLKETPGAYNGLAWVLIAGKVDMDEGIRLAQRGLKMKKTPELLHTLGWGYHLKGERDLALTWLEKALEAAGGSRKAEDSIREAIDQARCPARSPFLVAEIGFDDSSGNNNGFLDGGEKAWIVLRVKNDPKEGKAKGMAIKGRIKAEGPADIIKNIRFEEGVSFGDIEVGEMNSSRVQVRTDENLKSGDIGFRVEFTEECFNPPDTTVLQISTRALVPPDLKIAGYKINEGKWRKESPSDLKVIKGDHVNLGITVSNEGGMAEDVVVTVSSSSKSMNFLKKWEDLGIIGPGKAKKTFFTFSVDKSDRLIKEIPITLEVREKKGKYGASAVIPLAVERKDPALELVGKIETLNDRGETVKIERSKSILLKVVIQNNGQGVARVKKAYLKTDDPMVKISLSSAEIGNLKPGQLKVASFEFHVKRLYKGSGELPIEMVLQEELPDFSKSFSLPLALGATGDRVTVTVVKGSRDQWFPGGYGGGVSPKWLKKIAVDDLSTIPGAVSNKKNWGVVIGIEDYENNAPTVQFAARDARMMKEYFVRIIGIPEGQIITKDKWDMAKFLEVFDGEHSVLRGNVKKGDTLFIYYSGHGIAVPPEEGEKTGLKHTYLLPATSDPYRVTSTGYSLKKFYDNLNALPAEDVVLFLDTCFSGSAARPVITPKMKKKDFLVAGRQLVNHFLDPYGKVTTLASSKKLQISYAYKAMRHGLFTYFLMKGLKEGKRDINDLFDYIKPKVESTAANHLGVTQTPDLKSGSRKRIRF